MDRSTVPIILCVDDDKVTLKAIERSLISNGYTVLTADSGVRALKTLQKTRPALILLDAIMPNMDGYEVCEQLQKDPSLSTIPIIFVTAQEEGEEKTRALAIGASDYLIKPIQRDILLRKVAHHLELVAARNAQTSLSTDSSPLSELSVGAPSLSQESWSAQSAPAPVFTNGAAPSLSQDSAWTPVEQYDAEVPQKTLEARQPIEDGTQHLAEENIRLQAELVEQRQIEEALRQTREELEHRLQEQSVEFEQLRATLDAMQSTQHTLAESLRTAKNTLEELTQEIDHARHEREAERTQLQTALDEEHRARQTVEQSLHDLQKENALHREQGQFLTRVPDILIVLNTDGTLRTWNHGLEIVSGYASDELVGMPVLQLFDELVRDKIDTLLVGGTSEVDESVEAAFLTKSDLTIPYEWKSVRVTDANEQVSGFILTGHDLSDHKQIERTLRQAKEAAEQSSLAKSEFLANMSHEIRTPMNGIIGMNELLLDTPLTSEQYEYADTVKSSAEALLALLNDILDFSKIEARKLNLDSVAFSFRENLGDAMRALAFRAHQKGLELLYEVDPEVPDTVIGDPSRLRQVVTNLVGNAIKFTEKGEVAIRVEKTNAATDGVQLQFAVRDTGIGIPKDKQDLIFQAFSQADTSITRKYGGTGLGLAISTQLVRMMSGQLWLESEENQGSTFYFTASLGIGPFEDETELIAVEGLHGLTVLVVDDNANNRRILNDVFLSWKMVPSVADSADSAQALAREAKSNGQPFAFALIDARLPGTDGITLAQQLLEDSELAEAILMMVTSSDQKEERERLDNLALSGSLLKPIRPSELLTACLKARGNIVEETRKAKTPFAQKSQHCLRLLVAEDNAVNQKLAVRVLEKWGHHVTVAVNGELAYKAFLDEGPFDAILMDVEMPIMNGVETTATIRHYEERTGTHIPIIAMTAHAMVGDKERCLAAGMDGYVSKPLRAEELFETLERLMSAKTNATHSKHPATSLEDRPPEEEVFDRAELLTLVDGDVSLLTELTDLFTESSPQLIAQIREAAHTNALQSFSYAIHTLKGSVGNFAARRALTALTQVEAFGPQGDLSQAAPAIDRLEKELLRLREMLSSLRMELTT